MPTFTGDAGNNSLTGTSGDDLLEGLGGDDTLIDSLGGNDTLNGGEGNDRIEVTRGYTNVTVNIDGGDGDDVINVTGDTTGFLGTIMGGAGADRIVLSGARYGQGGINAGDGDDTVVIGRGSSGTILTLGQGVDRLALAADFNSVGIRVLDFKAGPGGDVLDLSAWLNSGNVAGHTPGANPFANGVLSLTEYSSQSTGLPYVVVNYGGNQIMVLENVAKADLCAENLGGFHVVATLDYQGRIEGNGDSETLNGSGSDNVLIGYGGDDLLNGGIGNDTLFGDDWRDGRYRTGTDILDGGAGNDTLVGGGGNDTLTGGDGDDVIYTGQVVVDSPYGPTFGGNTAFFSERPDIDGGFDTVDGGAGFDTAYLMYGGATSAVVLDISDPTVTSAVMVGGVQRGSVSGIERVVFYGGLAGDTMTASAGDDKLFGQAGDDVLHGGAGNDYLSGGAGADVLDGGDGYDVLDLINEVEGQTIDLNLSVQAGGDTLISIEGVTGSAFSDILRGTAGADTLSDLWGGNDVIEGRGGDDVIGIQRYSQTTNTVRIDGGDGNDTITVSGVTESILGGGAGDDVITFETDYGRATISLGAGRDTLKLNSVSKQVNHGHVVTDFQTGIGGDIVDLGYWTRGSFDPFRGGDVRLIQSGADTLLQSRRFNSTEYDTVLTFQNTQASTFSAANFGGDNPNPSSSYIVGDYLSNTLTGTVGNDDIDGADGSDSLRGGAGDDVIRAGDPPYFGMPSNGSGLDGGEGNDVLVGASAYDLLIGGLGSDVLRAGGGNDTLIGGVATFTSTAQTVYVNGQPMTVLTHQVTSVITDDGLVDWLDGGDGDDVLTLGIGDHADGGGGTDRASLSLAHLSTGVDLDLSRDSNAVLSALTSTTLRNIERWDITGTAFSDILRAGYQSTLYGGLGADVLYGGEGGGNLISGQYASQLVQAPNGRYVNGISLDDGAVDQIYGGAGTDYIYLGYGDHADGGAGNDVLYLTLTARTSGVDLNLTSGFAAAQASLAAVQGGSLANFESLSTLFLTNFNDVLRVGSSGSFYGAGGDDQLYGTDLVQFMGGDDGNDRLEAFGGNDRLWGGAGDDILLGGDGNDILEGDANNDNGLNPVTDGADLLDGGAGADTLNGGGGADTLIGGIGNDTLNGGAGTDTAVFSGNRSAYTFTTVNSTTTRVVGPDGTDTLTGIERLRFDDGLFDLAGNPLPNEVNGTPNADTLNGTEGADIIAAGDGDDLVTGGAGADIIDGGAGFDTAVFATGTVPYTVTANGGVITVTSSEGTDTLTNVERLRFGGVDLAVGALTGAVLIGTTTGETLTGGTGDDTLFGFAGNDVLNGGSGLDTANYAGAAGAVTARIDTQSASNDGDGGSDTFTSIENITGSAFNDLLVGDGAANVLSGGLGRDTIIAGGGNDTLGGGEGAANELYGGAGDDTYIVETLGDSIVEVAGEGTDTVQSRMYQTNLSANVENLTYVGTSTFTGVGNGLSNVITGGAQRDVLLGQGGDDILIGGAGAANELYGGAGNDTYVLDVADSIIEGADSGLDTVQLRALRGYTLGANVENAIAVGTGDFAITGNALDNVLTGGGMADTLQGGIGNDTLNGGGGIDTVTYILSTGGVYARLDAQRGLNDGQGGQDAFTGIENLTGSNLRDTLMGNAGDNVIDGAIGDDVLLGFDGNDTLIGGQGGGFNEMYGGRGDDLYVVSAGDTLIEAAGEGTDTVETSNGAFLLAANIEILTYTGSGNFAGTGNAGNNVINGGAGTDILNGLAGDDTLNGGLGDDLALLRGVRADYTLTAVEGGWRVTDSVAGRDGTDLLLGVERIAFSDGTVLVLGQQTAATAGVMPLLSDKTAQSDAFVLPALSDKVDGDAPLVLPPPGDGSWIGDEAPRDLQAIALFDRLTGDHALREPGPDLADAPHGPAHDWLW